MNKKRPVNLDLTTIKLPPTAIASILHRISGLLLFLLIPLMLYLLQGTLHSETTFLSTREFMQTVWMKLVLWALLSAFIYHLLAGIRHIIMDFGFGESLKVATLSAKLVVVLGILAIILTGCLIW